MTSLRPSQPVLVSSGRTSLRVGKPMEGLATNPGHQALVVYHQFSSVSQFSIARVGKRLLCPRLNAPSQIRIQPPPPRGSYSCRFAQKAHTVRMNFLRPGGASDFNFNWTTGQANQTTTLLRLASAVQYSTDPFS